MKFCSKCKNENISATKTSDNSEAFASLYKLRKPDSFPETDTQNSDREFSSYQSNNTPEKNRVFLLSK